MIDIHCHILPNVDDGSKSLEESIDLARAEAEGGTKVMIATPHVNTVRELERSPELIEKIDALNHELAHAGIDLHVAYGAELYPMMNVVDGVRRGLPVTLGGSGRYVLLDTPRASLPLDLGALVFELLSLGITPILAHPERTIGFQQDPNTLLEILDRGVVCQVNTGSLNGKYGPPAKETAYLILRRQWAHFLASDAHGPKDYGTLGRAVEKLKDELSSEYLEILTEKSGAAVLAGEKLPRFDRRTEDPPKPSLISRLFGARR